ITLGVLTKKGPGFFELFGPIEQGALHEANSVSYTQLSERFEAISKEGVATPQSVRTFLQQVRPSGIVDRAVSLASKVLPISEKPLYLALLVLIVASFNAFAMFWYRFSTKMCAIRVSRDLRQAYFEHIQTLPMSFYQKHSSGSLSSRVVSDAVAIADGVNATLTNYLQTPFTVTTTLALCFYASWKLTLFIFLGLPLIAYPIVLIARHVRRLSRQLQKNQESFSSVLLDYLSGVQTVKIFGIEHFSLKKYREENDRMAHIERKSAKYDVSSRPIVHTLGMTFLCTALIIGLYFFNMSVPEVLVYCGLLYVFYEPVKKFAETNAMIQRGAAAAERMQEVLDVRPEIEDAPDAVELTNFTEKIEFKEVSFRYGESWILREINLTVGKGETVALVGPTGSGKSTLANLLPRLYDVQKGQILIDGKPLQAYTQKSLRALMAFVPQKPFLFMDTVRENITFGNPESDEAVLDAAKRAHALEFIEKLPDGIDTLL
ncbi:MAG: ABC transporter ATP-binding protein, partial [Chlamydiia bacterium]|nr:ABC transporter ATP-binding protein [Chlamydiia bacterium]